MLCSILTGQYVLICKNPAQYGDLDLDQPQRHHHQQCRVVNDSGAAVSPREPDAATNRTVDAYYVEIESSTTVIN
jgi:hypothetical protein